MTNIKMQRHAVLKTALLVFIAILLFLMFSSVANGKVILTTKKTTTREYPRVYGPTGRLYGPTQADYQYRKQYGRDWHGYRGLQTTHPRTPRPRTMQRHHHHYDHATYGYGYSPYRYGFSNTNYYYPTRPFFFRQFLQA